MSDIETAKHLREWVKTKHGLFSWPTDGCGYEQHIKFVEHRNSYFKGGTPEDFNKFVLEYADTLDNRRADGNGE